MNTTTNTTRPTYTATIGPITVNQYQIVDLGQVNLAAGDTGVRGVISGSCQVAAPGEVVTLRTELSLQAGMTSLTLPAAVFTLSLPPGCQLRPGSMALDGEVLAAFGSDQVTVTLGDLSLSAGSKRVLTCLVQMDDSLSATQMVFSGSLDWSTQKHQNLVPAQVAIANLTLNAPSVLTAPQTTVSGRGPAGAIIRVYDETLLLGEAQASAGGYWFLHTTLPDKGSPVTHRLHAITDWQSVRLQSNDVEVSYNPNQPVITEIVLKQDYGREVVFRPTDGVARFPYVVKPGMGFELIVRFSRPELVRNVEVSISPYSAPAFSSPDGSFRARVNFSAWNLGPIYLKYETIPDPEEFDDQAPTIDELRDQLPWEFRDVTYEQETGPVTAPVDWPAGENPRSAAVNFTLPRRPDIAGRVEMTVARDVAYSPTADDLQSVAETGIPVYGFKLITPSFAGASNTFDIWVEGYIPESVLETDPPVGGAALLFSRAIGGEGQPVSGLGLSAAGLDAVVHIGTKVSFSTGGAFNLYDWTTTIADGFGIAKTLDELGDMREQAGECGSLGRSYEDQIDAIARRAAIGEGTKYAMMVAGTVLGPETFGLGTLALWGASKAMEYAIDKSIQKSMDRVKQDMANDQECKKKEKDEDDDNDDDNDDPSDPKKKKVADPKWIWDPSGVVYEAVLENPLADVRATIYQRDAATGTMVPWDAAWYGQTNQLTTGADGYYGWDVPPGEWQVVYEKAGYASAQSAVLTVPPPQTGVDINLQSLSAPALTGVTAAAGGGYLDLAFDRYMQAGMLNVSNIRVSFTGAEGVEAVSGQIALTATAPDPVDPTRLYTKQARFVPDTALAVGNVYQVWVSGAVQSYSGIPLGGDQERAVTIPAVTPPPVDPGEDPGDDTPSGGEPVVQPAGEVINPQVTVGVGEATVTWTDPVATGLRQVKLSWKVSGGAALLGSQTLVRGVQTYTITGLQSGTTYEITLQTIDQLGRESAGTSLTVMLPAANEIRQQLDGTQQTIRGFEQAVVLSVPTGAFAAGTELLIRQLDDAVPPRNGAMSLVSHVYQLAAGGAEPSERLTLLLRYDSGLLGDRDVRQLGIYREQEGQPGVWQYVGGVADLQNQRLSAEISRPGNYAVLLYQPTFSDLVGHWARRDVEVMAARHLIPKTVGDRFEPNRAITRGELASLLVQLVSLIPARAETSVQLPASFSDVPADHPYSLAILQAAGTGLMVGANQLFRPDDPISREELAALLLRVMNRLGQAQLANTVALPFADNGQISRWAFSAVTVAWSKGLLAGVSTQLFQPKGTVTRAQISVVLFRLMERMGLVTATAVQKGTLVTSELEGRHFELIDCAGTEASFVLIAVSDEVKRQLAQLSGQSVQVTGLRVQGVSQYMTGSLFRVFTVSASSGG